MTSENVFMGFVVAIMLIHTFDKNIDTETQRINACVESGEMEYIDGDCRRVQPAE
jgi:hypothetical protein